MVEEVDIKSIQKAKATAEKAKKATERKAQKEEVKQENKMLKVKKNTVMNKAATSVPPPQQQVVVFSEYKDTFILSYFELIAKMASKYIKNCSEETLKKRLLTSRDLDKLLSHLTNLEIENPILLLLITTLSHILTDSIHNKVIQDAQVKPDVPNDGGGGLEIKPPEQKSGP